MTGTEATVPGFRETAAEKSVAVDGWTLEFVHVPVKLLTHTLSTHHGFPQLDGSSPPLEQPYLFPESFGPTIKGPRKSNLWSQAACRIWTKDDGYPWKLLDPLYMSLINTPMFTLLVCKSPPMATREPGPLMESHILHSEVDFCLRLGPPHRTISLL